MRIGFYRVIIVFLMFVSIPFSFLYATEPPHAYPVPWIPYDGKEETGEINEGITFVGLSPPCTIKIYSSSGIKVKELSADTDKVVWEVGTEGERVSSGFYIYSIEKDNISVARGKLLIIW